MQHKPQINNVITEQESHDSINYACINIENILFDCSCNQLMLKSFIRIIVNSRVAKVTRLSHLPAFEIKHSPLVQEAKVVINKVSAEGAVRTKVEEGKRFWSKHKPLEKEAA